MMVSLVNSTFKNMEMIHGPFFLIDSGKEKVSVIVSDCMFSSCKTSGEGSEGGGLSVKSRNSESMMKMTGRNTFEKNTIREGRTGWGGGIFICLSDSNEISFGTETRSNPGNNAKIGKCFYLVCQSLKNSCFGCFVWFRIDDS